MSDVSRDTRTLDDPPPAPPEVPRPVGPPSAADATTPGANGDRATARHDVAKAVPSQYDASTAPDRSRDAASAEAEPVARGPSGEQVAAYDRTRAAAADEATRANVDAPADRPKPAGDFTPEPRTVDARGFLTDGTSTISPDANARHSYDTHHPEKSYFNEDVDVDQLTLDATQYADQHDLWSADGKAKVQFDREVGVNARSGEATDVVNVYRKQNGMAHASPGGPID